MQRGRFFHLLSCSLSVSALLIFPAVWASTYVVKQGDTLSSALYQSVSGRLWGKGGLIEKTLARNPNIKDPNLIFPGEKIEIPDSEIADEPSKRSIASASEPEPQPESTPSPESVAPQAQASSTPIPRPDLYFERHSSFNFKPSLFFFRLDGKDLGSGAQAHVLSNLSYDFELSWDLHWSPSFRTRLFGAIEHIGIEPTLSGQAISNPSVTSERIGFEAEGDWNERWAWGAGVLLGQELFLRSDSASSMNIDTIMVPEFTLRLRYAMIPTRPIGMGLEGQGRFALSSDAGSYTTSSGLAYSGALYFEQRLQKSVFGADLYYGRSGYSSSVVDQTRVDLGVRFRFQLEVGP